MLGFHWRSSTAKEIWVAIEPVMGCVFEMVPMPKLRMNVYLSAEQNQKLEGLSGRSGAPVAELIRRAIEAYLISRKKELK